jgi:hypothetical protein
MHTCSCPVGGCSLAFVPRALPYVYSYYTILACTPRRPAIRLINILCDFEWKQAPAEDEEGSAPNKHCMRLLGCSAQLQRLSSLRPPSLLGTAAYTGVSASRIAPSIASAAAVAAAAAAPSSSTSGSSYLFRCSAISAQIAPARSSRRQQQQQRRYNTACCVHIIIHERRAWMSTFDPHRRSSFSLTP